MVWRALLKMSADSHCQFSPIWWTLWLVWYQPSKRAHQKILFFKFLDSTMNFGLNFVFQCLWTFFYHSNACHELWKNEIFNQNVQHTPSLYHCIISLLLEKSTNDSLYCHCFVSIVSIYVYYISNLLNTRKGPRHLLLFFKSSQKKALHPDQSRNTNKIFFFQLKHTGQFW